MHANGSMRKETGIYGQRPRVFVGGDGKLQKHYTSQERIPTEASTRGLSPTKQLGLNYTGPDTSKKSKSKMSHSVGWCLDASGWRRWEWAPPSGENATKLPKKVSDATTGQATLMRSMCRLWLLCKTNSKCRNSLEHSVYRINSWTLYLWTCRDGCSKLASYWPYRQYVL